MTALVDVVAYGAWHNIRCCICIRNQSSTSLPSVLVGAFLLTYLSSMWSLLVKCRLQDLRCTLVVLKALLELRVVVLKLVGDGLPQHLILNILFILQCSLHWRIVTA